MAESTAARMSAGERKSKLFDSPSESSPHYREAIDLIRVVGRENKADSDREACMAFLAWRMNCERDPDGADNEVARPTEEQAKLVLRELIREPSAELYEAACAFFAHYTAEKAKQIASEMIFVCVRWTGDEGFRSAGEWARQACGLSPRTLVDIENELRFLLDRDPHIPISFPELVCLRNPQDGAEFSPLWFEEMGSSLRWRN
ncbi:MAG: hypothetical protein ING19_20120 [Azospirillum sp.]|nr:hypothetical protein [Azospirillum sp.]